MSYAIEGPFSKAMAEVVKEKLEMKYNEEFRVERVFCRDILKKYYDVDAYSLSNPTIMFSAGIDYNSQNLFDEYNSKKMCVRLSDLIAKNLDALNGIYYIYSETKMPTYNLDDENMTINDYMQQYPMEQFNIYMMFLPNEKNGKIFAKCIKNAFKNIEYLSGEIRLYIINKDENLEEIQDYIESNSRIYYDFKKIAGSFFKGNIHFEKGIILEDDDKLENMIEK